MFIIFLKGLEFGFLYQNLPHDSLRMLLPLTSRSLMSSVLLTAQLIIKFLSLFLRGSTRERLS